MKNKILILGIEGMVGRSVYKYFLNNKKYITFGTSRINNKKRVLKYDFPKDNKNLDKFLSENNINFIINCIGVLRNSKNSNFVANYKLPLLLNEFSNKYHCRVIQISSDAVFKDTSGTVNELDKPNPQGIYGKSKLKGEINSSNFINIRTSFVGFDPVNKKGLIEWLINDKNKKINGYINQHWSGSTTLQFAKLCDFLITGKNFTVLNNKTKILHFTPLGPMTKFELLKSISFGLKLKKEIVEKNSNKITRNLTSIFFDREFLNSYTTEINSALLDLKKFEIS